MIINEIRISNNSTMQDYRYMFSHTLFTLDSRIILYYC